MNILGGDTQLGEDTENNSKTLFDKVAIKFGIAFGCHLKSFSISHHLPESSDHATHSVPRCSHFAHTPDCTKWLHKAASATE